jgi:hypothetical protein
LKTRRNLTGKIRGRPPKLPVKHDPENPAFDFHSDEMARDFKRQMDRLRKPPLYGYNSDTDKVVFETYYYSRASELLLREGRLQTTQNLALALIDVLNADRRCKDAIERWLRSGRKTSLKAALRERSRRN